MTDTCRWLERSWPRTPDLLKWGAVPSYDKHSITFISIGRSGNKWEADGCLSCKVAEGDALLVLVKKKGVHITHIPLVSVG